MSDQAHTSADVAPARRAVVVDDDAANLYYAGKILRERGYEIATARGYFDALQALHPDTALLLADIRLNKGNGFELARVIRDRVPDIKILLMTAYTEEELRAQDLLWPVIRIPFTRRGLMTSLRRIDV